MAGTLRNIVGTIKSLAGWGDAAGEPSTNNDIGAFRGLFLNAFSSWSNSFDSRRAYKFYDQSRPLASTIDLISDAFAEIEPAIFDRETKQWITANGDEPEAEVLKLLKNPGFGQTYRQFAGDLGTSYLLDRNGFFIMHGNINRGPLALSVAKPFYVDEREGNDGYVDEYRFSKNTGRGQQATFKRIKPSVFRFVHGNLLEIYHIMGKTNDDGLRGRSPISALFWDILQNIQGGQHNANMLKNSTRTSGAFVAAPDNPLTDDQFVRLKEQMAEQYTGAMNAGRSLLLENGMQFQDMTISNKDMDYAALMMMSSDATSIRYKVPLALTNKEAMTLDNYKLSVITLYDDATEPLAKAVYEGIEAAMFDRFGIDRNRFSLLPNPASVNAAIIRQVEKMKLMKETGAFTQNEIRSVDGAEAIEGGDTLYAPGNVQPVGTDSFVTNPEKPDDKLEKSAYAKILETGGLSKKAAQANAEKVYGP